MTGPLQRFVDGVLAHNVLVVVIMLLASAGVAYGVTDLQMQSESNASDAIGDTEEYQKFEYVNEHYANRSDDAGERDPAVVYVRDANGNVLSKGALLDSLRYQRAVLENESIAGALAADHGNGGVLGVSNVVATRLAGDEDATLDDQIAALEAADDSEVDRATGSALAAGSPALDLLPADYEPGTTTADSRRMLFQFAAPADDETTDDADGAPAAADRSSATRHLYQTAGDRSTLDYFTLGDHAWADRNQQLNQQTLELVLPAALLAIVAVLAFAYRDLVDVVVGFFGVLLSVLWMFGILGWLGVPAGMTLIIGPVLVVGLSVDYGLHVFMRHREERDEETGIREAMSGSLRSVGVALAVVTATTAVGFLANLTTDFNVIRQLAVGITLGVVSAFVIFLTLVPALKVTVDGLLERVGLDRRNRALGKSRFLEPILGSGAAAARRAAPAVVALALVLGAAGGVAWAELDRETVQSDAGGVAEWKQDLPEPFAWDVHPLDGNDDYVDEHYRATDADARRTSQVLVEGDVTADGTLEALSTARTSLSESDVPFERNGEVRYVSPSSVMRSVAATDDAFARTFEAADTNGDGVPDRNLERVYDGLYDAAPDRAALVVERTDGEYRSVRLLVPVTAAADRDAQVTAMREATAEIEDREPSVSAIAVGAASVGAAETRQMADGILETLLVALGAVGLILSLIYRGVAGSASLGAVTAVPITLVLSLVVAGMYVLDIPLTFLTALLMSLVIGLGIDYNIHVSDRFAQELDAGRTVDDALHEAVTGTGGALLGSTLTSTGAFAALLLHPHPQITSFGALVVLALATSFVVSVYVLPSMLSLWARAVRTDTTGGVLGTTVDPSAGD